jgi:hypothetical protein
LLDNRVFDKFALSGTAEVIARTLVTANYDFLELGTLTTLTNSFNFEKTSLTLGGKTIIEILELDKAGHTVFYDLTNKKWYFKILKTAVNPLILSPSMLNALSPIFVYDTKNYASRLCFEHELIDNGEWNASTNTPSLTDNTTSNFSKKWKVATAGTRFNITWNVGDFIGSTQRTGKLEKITVDKFTTFLDIENKTGIKRKDFNLSANTDKEALGQVPAFWVYPETQVTAVNLKHKTDYNLGDIVRVQAEFGQIKQPAVNFLIWGVEKWYEYNNIGERPILKGGV